MKTSNRVQPKTTTNRLPEQANGASPSRPEICREAREAILEFNNVASAALALATHHASYIKMCIRERPDWEDFDLGGVVSPSGMLALPRILADNFRSTFRDWVDAINQMAKRIEAGQLAGLEVPITEGEIEYFVRGVGHLIEMQDHEISSRNDSTYGLSIIIKERLDAAFHRALRAYGALASFVRAHNGNGVQNLSEPGIEDGGYEGYEAICLTLIDTRLDVPGEGNMVAGCDLSPSELTTLRRKSAAAGLPIGTLLRQAVDWLLTRQPARSA